VPAALAEARLTVERTAPAWQFDTALGLRKLCEQLRVASLAGFNAQDLRAAAGRRRRAPELRPSTHRAGRSRTCAPLSVQRASDLLALPPTTHRNLELTQTLRGEDAPTLLSLIDTCRTGMGSRALRHWLTQPGARTQGSNPAP